MVLGETGGDPGAAPTRAAEIHGALTTGLLRSRGSAGKLCPAARSKITGILTDGRGNPDPICIASLWQSDVSDVWHARRPGAARKLLSIP